MSDLYSEIMETVDIESIKNINTWHVEKGTNPRTHIKFFDPEKWLPDAIK